MRLDTIRNVKEPQHHERRIIRFETNKPALYMLSSWPFVDDSLGKALLVCQTNITYKGSVNGRVIIYFQWT